MSSFDDYFCKKVITAHSSEEIIAAEIVCLLIRMVSHGIFRLMNFFSSKAKEIIGTDKPPLNHHHHHHQKIRRINPAYNFHHIRYIFLLIVIAYHSLQFDFIIFKEKIHWHKKEEVWRWASWNKCDIPVPCVACVDN